MGRYLSYCRYVEVWKSVRMWNSFTLCDLTYFDQEKGGEVKRPEIGAPQIFQVPEGKDYLVHFSDYIRVLSLDYLSY